MKINSERVVFRDIYQELDHLKKMNKQAVLATVIEAKGSTPRKVGAKMLVYPDGTISGTIGGGVREADVINAAMKLFENKTSDTIEVDFTEGLKDGTGPVCGGSMTVFLDYIANSRTAFLCGAGHISYYLYPILKMLEYDCIIIDPRSELNNTSRFPDASCLLRDFDEEIKDLQFSTDDAVVLVGPGHVEDTQMLSKVLKTDAGYIGMIGSKRKIKQVYDILLGEGYNKNDLQRVHAPIGLDIGSESPQEIALAIAAEIVKYSKSDKD